MHNCIAACCMLLLMLLFFCCCMAAGEYDEKAVRGKIEGLIKDNKVHTGNHKQHIRCSCTDSYEHTIK